MTKDMSKRALLEFLEYAGSKGLMNSATVSARRAAVNKVLGILEEDEAADVTTLDLDQVMDRFFNLNRSTYKPESMAAYKSRVKSSIEDFIAYQSNPLGFRSASSSAVRRTPEKRREASGQAAGANTDAPEAGGGIVSRPSAMSSIMPIPIRSDLTVYIQGLPFDLTKSEANRIANVIRALASGDDE